MSYYGGTITVKGRNLITSLLAGETIEFTRIVVGSGAMPEGVEPIDMEALVAPVAEGTSTIPVVEGGEMFLTVEYRNDLNGGLEKGFWLREFGIFAKTANTEEVLLYYATLGDSPQPVNAYQDNRIDIRRYPITIALEVDADVQVTYNPGSFITAEDAEDLIGGMVATSLNKAASIRILKDFVIPADGWVVDDEDDDDPYGYRLDLALEDVDAEDIPFLSLSKKSLTVAGNAGLCPTIETQNGVLNLWAERIPGSNMTGELTLVTKLNGGTIPGSGGGTYVLPVASSSTLGGVRINENSGLKIDGEGNLSVNFATDEEAADAIEDALKTESGGGSNEPGEDLPDGYEMATDEEVAQQNKDIFG